MTGYLYYAWGQSGQRTKPPMGQGCSIGKKKPSEFLMEHEGQQDELDTKKKKKENQWIQFEKAPKAKDFLDHPQICSHKGSNCMETCYMEGRVPSLEMDDGPKAAIKYKESLRASQSLDSEMKCKVLLLPPKHLKTGVNSSEQNLQPTTDPFTIKALISSH